MPLYHFNVYNGSARLNSQGTTFADLGNVRVEAIRIACDLLRAEIDRTDLEDEWRVEATDESGMILFRIDFILSATVVGSGPVPLLA